MTLLGGKAASAAFVLMAGLVTTAGGTDAARGAEGAPADERAVVYTSDGTPSSGLAAYAAMMAVPSEDTGYVPAVTAPRNDPAACPPRRCVDRRVPVPDGVTVSGSMTRILLPKGYFKKKNRGTRYPVVYLFNGALSDYDAYTQLTQLTSMAKRWKAIFVMPQGGHGELPGMFSDWADGSFDWETFHIDVLIPWVDRKFRTIPGGRAAVGLSMGGLGALLYAERHPKVFKAAFSMSGVVDTSVLATGALPPELASALGMDPPTMRRVWGDPVLDRRTWARHNPAENVSKLRGTLVLISSGTGYPQHDPDDPIHSGLLEQMLWTTHRHFFAQMVAHGVPFKARINQGGVHNYPWFDGPLRWGLPQVIEAARR